ncbi:MAG: hypothetical protein IJ444_00015 [Kiritimatiellae bacterium]|nr:hypothetical protein [Kiritimatiellia bacterium]
MEQSFTRPDLLPITVPSFVLWILAIGAIALWVTAHIMLKRKEDKFRPRNRFLIVFPVACVASWAVIQCLGRYFFLACYWHVFFFAILAAGSVEGVSILYEHERKSLKKGVGRQLLGCRIAAIVTVLFVLLQPILVGETERVIRRTVAVLVDDSESMNFIDQQWTDTQKLEIASALGLLTTDGENLHGFGNRMNELFAELATPRQILSIQGGEKNIDVAEFSKTLDSLLHELTRATKICDEGLPKINKQKHNEIVNEISRVHNHIKARLIPQFTSVKTSLEDKSAQLVPQMTAAMASLEQGMPLMKNLDSVADLVHFDSLTEDEQANVLAVAEDTRSELVRKLIGKGGENSAVNQLAKKYDVAVYRFGSAAKASPAYRQLAEDGSLPAGIPTIESDENILKSFRSTTDISKALETVLKEIPSEELAGILIFSDGRYTAEVGIDSLTRKLGGLDIPVSTVVVGGTISPYDVSIASVISPESVFLGDKIRFTVQVNATGARLKKSKISLFLGDEPIDSKDFTVGSDDWSHEFKFTHLPEAHGVLRYKVVVDGLENEEFADNNEQIVDISVSDDRTNVLLVDDRPRWEFRYLRNLFYGRDKSVHLQEMLIRPDRVEGITVKKRPASASRKFGDSESGSFPVSRDEWRKFDVIILGDLPPSVLTESIVEELKYCVKERGALLVFISGRNYFPHKFSPNSSINELIPVEYDQDSIIHTKSPESSYLFTLTPAGRGHQAMSQSASSAENEEIWSDLPEFTWRFPVKGIKPGAEVLAYARSKDFNQENFTSSIATAATEDPEEAIRRLDELRKEQERNSLIVSRSLGRGKVMMLNTDNTWRLRYRIGDTRHHRFWGQVLRWGAGEKLRAGNTFVRLGTDQLRYSPDEKIKVFARIVDRNYNTISGLSPDIQLFNEQGIEIGGYSLKYREDSNGFYEIELPEISEAGVYDIRLSCSKAANKLGSDFPVSLSTKFVVVTAKQPVEFVNITATKTSASKMAKMTNGTVFSPLEFVNAKHDYGEGNKTLIERSEFYLWDSWILFVIVILCLTYEWILRKRVGIA